ncbi:hypothetical protein [Glycomyces salinus]|uniref:hypothetical protein n=1 Tax=Glycomyces salinus TaxID=980294 RepID=UPI0018EC041C|nr:hypothetical protein [Glycomyces salinus]
MTTNKLFQDTVREMALGNGSKARELNSQIPDAARDSYVIYVAAMFTGVTAAHLGEDPNHESIRDFVNRTAYAYRKADPPFKPMTMEALIRVIYGEDHLLDEVSPEDQLRFELLAIRMIVHENQDIKARLDDYLADAETLAAQWQSEA